MQVTARLMDRQYTKIGPEMSTISHHNSSIHSPSYKFHTEIHEPHLPPTATYLFKVWKLIIRRTNKCYHFCINEVNVWLCFFVNLYFLTFQFSLCY